VDRLWLARIVSSETEEYVVQRAGFMRPLAAPRDFNYFLFSDFPRSDVRDSA